MRHGMGLEGSATSPQVRARRASLSEARENADAADAARAELGNSERDRQKQMLEQRRSALLEKAKAKAVKPKDAAGFTRRSSRLGNSVLSFADLG